MAEPKVTEIPKGIIDKLTGTLKLLKDVWFGPGTPPPAAAQEEKGRKWDYPVGYNMGYAPRQEEALSFGNLRGMAQNCGMLRIIIERRKSQICGIPWKIKLKQDRTEDGKSIQPDEATKKRLTECQLRWTYPDREKPFVTWLRALLEDMFVLDALCVEPRKNYGGQVIGHDLIDGATITRKLDRYARTPEVPGVAYQQYLKGVIAVDLTTEDMLYGMSNPRSDKVYGYGPVEQIITIANMSLRRDVHKLQYYTEGSTPDMIVHTPEGWSADDIEKVETSFNNMLEGNTAIRRKAKFLPAKDITELKTDILKDQFDEWLARIIAYAFGLSPSSLVQMMNRAQSESIKEDSLQEGLAFPLLYVKAFIDRLIQVYEGNPDFEFIWEQEIVIDAQTRANVNKVAQDNGWKSVDVIRREMGEDPLGIGPMFTTPAGIVTPEQYRQGIATPTAGPEFEESAQGIMSSGRFQEASRAAIADITRRKKKSYGAGGIRN